MKVSCFNYSKVEYFASSCFNPYTILRINKIKQDIKVSSNKANNKVDSKSKLEN